MFFGVFVPASPPVRLDVAVPAGPLGLPATRLLIGTARQLGLRMAAVAAGDLTAALRCDDNLEAAGLHPDSRYTCASCRDWADHAHTLSGGRRSLADYERENATLPPIYRDPTTTATAPRAWIAVGPGHFHSGFLSSRAQGACLRVRPGGGAGVSWLVHHPAAMCVRAAGEHTFGIDGDLADAHAAATAALERATA
ncbi:hypothetical protein ACIGO9_29675 [Nocardia asteroides]|uniref:hypothetical protein n=1 Tax=Nocardia asteroides TaxID=1824 RepID=UPI0037CB07FE